MTLLKYKNSVEKTKQVIVWVREGFWDYVIDKEFKKDEGVEMELLK